MASFPFTLRKSSLPSGHKHLPRAKSQLLQSSFFTHLAVDHSPPPPVVQPPSNRSSSYILHHRHLFLPHDVAHPTHPLRTTVAPRCLS
ncbi:hypothetical protein SESBI_36917 [Sesbania bispinosa]|nr:hypothetical protein SESBI_36917 [Sesbania bispinosa]